MDPTLERMLTNLGGLPAKREPVPERPPPSPLVKTRDDVQIGSRRTYTQSPIQPHVQPTQPSAQRSAPMDSGKIFRLVIGVISALAGLFWIVTDTPERRAENEKLSLQKALEEEKTKQMAIQRDIALAGAGANRKGQQTAPASGPVFGSGACVSPHPGQTAFERPVMVASGGCVNLPPASVNGMYFWAVFKDAPSNMSGVTEVRRARFTGTLVADGTRDVEPLDGCTGDSCTAFVSKHLGEVLFVRQTVGKQLDIKL